MRRKTTTTILRVKMTRKGLFSRSLLGSKTIDPKDTKMQIAGATTKKMVSVRLK